MHGSLSARTTLAGFDVTARCDEGYTFSHGVYEYSLMCDEQSAWNDTVQDCLGN